MSNNLSFPLRQTGESVLTSLARRLYDHVADRILQLTAVNELEQLTDHQLRDIGVDRRQIEEIAAREIAKLHAK